MGILIVGFYLIYFLIVYALFRLVERGFGSKVGAYIILSVGLAFPFLDYYVPQLSLQHFCSQNLKFVNKLPAKNVEGFYSESTRGTCDHCWYEIFTFGYKFVEGRIEKGSSSMHFDRGVSDLRGSLYRFTLISSSTDKNTFSCPNQNISAQYKSYKLGNLDKISYFCIEAKKIDKVSAPFLYVKTIRKPKSMTFGSVSEYIFSIKKIDGEVLLFDNSFGFKPNNILFTNKFFSKGCGTRNKVSQQSIVKLLIPKQLNNRELK